MVLVLTDSRLIVIARTGRKFRDVGDVLASVPRTDILGASRPTVGGSGELSCSTWHPVPP
jgi:hypothetical protein